MRTYEFMATFTHACARERERRAMEKERRMKVYGNYLGKCREIYSYSSEKREFAFKKHMTVNIIRKSCSDYLCVLRSKRIAKGGEFKLCRQCSRKCLLARAGTFLKYFLSHLMYIYIYIYYN